MQLSLAALTLVSGALATYENSRYDFIVVGGGTAGLAVASRLSENPAISVAIIEAGPSVLDNPNVTATDGYGLAFGTDIDWQYESVNQTYAGGNAQVLRAAKALGGTSTINGMSYFRAETSQIDAWGLLGNEGWSWDSLLPYYKKSERFQPPTESQAAAGATYNASYHGYDGPISVGWLKSIQNGSLVEDANATYQALGIDVALDANDGSMRGFYLGLSTLDTELDVRSDAARAYYWPVSGRSNLHAYLNSYAERMIWDSPSRASSPFASGVVFTDASGKSQTLYANKEIILSAGALGSPVLLERSGVGNPSILEQFGIDVKVDLPFVGENMQDQTNSEIDFMAAENLTGIPTFVSYLSANDLYGDETASINASLRASLPAYAEAVANVTGGTVNASNILKTFEIQHDLIFGPDSQLPMTEIIIISSGNSLGFQYWPLLPFSRGNIHITSANSSVPASINPNFFHLDIDVKAHVETTRWARKIAATAPFSNYVVNETTPGIAALPVNASDAAYQEWINGAYRSNFHAISTTAMMARELGGVVDSGLKVYGTANVRVVDASVLPMQVSGHLTATLYAIAEKISDVIKAEYAI